MNIDNRQKDTHQAFSRRIFGSLFITAILLLSLLSSPSNAEKVDLLPSLVLTGGYDDNILFTRTEPIADYYIKAKPGLDLKVASERYDIGLDVYVEAYRYLEENDLDVENYKYELDGGYNLSTRWSVRGNAYYLKDTTLDSELEETGRVGIRENRERFLASGQLSFQLGEASNLGLNYEFTKTNYESDERVNRDVHSFDFRYERWLNERVDSLSIMPTFNMASTEQGTDIDYYRLSAGWIHIFSKTLRMRNVLGYGYTVTTEDGDERSNQVGNADLSLTQSAETSSVNLGFKSDIRLDSFGELLEVDRIYLNVRKKVTERLDIRFYGSYYVTRPLEIFDRADRTYYVLKPAVTYRMTKNHMILLSYKYENEYNHTLLDNPDRDRNVVELLFDFEFPIK